MFLITTADERTWKFDRPVLFLGEWCRLYARRHVWQAMDATTARPYGLRIEEKQRDLAYVLALTDRLLDEAAAALNILHQTTHTRRYWSIVLGYWLRRYVQTAFNRYSTLAQALENYRISETSLLDAPDYRLATPDSYSFIWACNNDVWNHMFYARVVDALDARPARIARCRYDGEQQFDYEIRHSDRPDGIKRRLSAAANVLLPALKRDRDAFITASYFPIGDELKLQLGLGQFPQRWQSPAIRRSSYDATARSRFRLDAAGHTGFERFVREQLSEVIPTCYLEGYAELRQQADDVPWPRVPRFIFTSNNFDTDEVFKTWTASKVERGTPYFVGQHGNNYGTHFYAGRPDWPERSASDRFFTWGWSDGNANVVPAFNFKISSSKSSRSDPDGGLLLVELCVGHLITPWDSYYEFQLYQEEQFRFAAALPESIRRRLTVRLHAEHRSHTWSDEQRWHDRDPDITLDANPGPMSAALRKSRLVVHSYDSTGILETLSLNIPTLCFWQGGLEQILPSARPHYQRLVDAGIVRCSPEQAAADVTRHWDHIQAWWQSAAVQDAREAFCGLFSKTNEHPVRTMKQLLLAAEGSLS